MSPSTMKPGGEIDAWCTKCRMDLLHRIIAVHAGKVVRVECRTCGGHHAYHRPRSAPKDVRASSGGAGSSSRAQSPRAPAQPGARAVAAQEAERLRTVDWERAILGQPVSAFKAYRATANFERGDLIKHGKFGDGYIVRVLDRQKVEAMFKDGPRTLAQGLTD